MYSMSLQTVPYSTKPLKYSHCYLAPVDVCYPAPAAPMLLKPGNGHRKGPAGNYRQAVPLMTRMHSLLIVMVLALSGIPAAAQQQNKTDASKATGPTEITGTVQSLSSNILDVKPYTVAPAVWITIPAGMKIDRAALKPGVNVTVEARWAMVTYIALKPPKIVAAKKSASQ